MRQEGFIRNNDLRRMVSGRMEDRGIPSSSHSRENSEQHVRVGIISGSRLRCIVYGVNFLVIRANCSCGSGCEAAALGT